MQQIKRFFTKNVAGSLVVTFASQDRSTQQVSAQERRQDLRGADSKAPESTKAPESKCTVQYTPAQVARLDVNLDRGASLPSGESPPESKASAPAAAVVSHDSKEKQVAERLPAGLLKPAAAVVSHDSKKEQVTDERLRAGLLKWKEISPALATGRPGRALNEALLARETLQQQVNQGLQGVEGGQAPDALRQLCLETAIHCALPSLQASPPPVRRVSEWDRYLVRNPPTIDIAGLERSVKSVGRLHDLLQRQGVAGYDVHVLLSALRLSGDIEATAQTDATGALNGLSALADTLWADCAAGRDGSLLLDWIGVSPALDKAIMSLRAECLNLLLATPGGKGNREAGQPESKDGQALAKLEADFAGLREQLQLALGKLGKVINLRGRPFSSEVQKEVLTLLGPDAPKLRLLVGAVRQSQLAILHSPVAQAARKAWEAWERQRAPHDAKDEKGAAVELALQRWHEDPTELQDLRAKIATLARSESKDDKKGAGRTSLVQAYRARGKDVLTEMYAGMRWREWERLGYKKLPSPEEALRTMRALVELGISSTDEAASVLEDINTMAKRLLTASKDGSFDFLQNRKVLDQIQWLGRRAVEDVAGRAATVESFFAHRAPLQAPSQSIDTPLIVRSWLDGKGGQSARSPSAILQVTYLALAKVIGAKAPHLWDSENILTEVTRLLNEWDVRQEDMQEAGLSLPPEVNESSLRDWLNEHRAPQPPIPSDPKERIKLFAQGFADMSLGSQLRQSEQKYLGLSTGQWAIVPGVTTSAQAAFKWGKSTSALRSLEGFQVSQESPRELSARNTFFFGIHEAFGKAFSVGAYAGWDAAGSWASGTAFRDSKNEGARFAETVASLMLAAHEKGTVTLADVIDAAGTPSQDRAGIARTRENKRTFGMSGGLGVGLNSSLVAEKPDGGVMARLGFRGRGQTRRSEGNNLNGQLIKSDFEVVGEVAVTASARGNVVMTRGASEEPKIEATLGKEFKAPVEVASKTVRIASGDFRVGQKIERNRYGESTDATEKSFQLRAPVGASVLGSVTGTSLTVQLEKLTKNGSAIMEVSAVQSLLRDVRSDEIISVSFGPAAPVLKLSNEDQSRARAVLTGRTRTPSQSGSRLQAAAALAKKSDALLVADASSTFRKVQVFPVQQIIQSKGMDLLVVKAGRTRENQGRYVGRQVVLPPQHVKVLFEALNQPDQPEPATRPSSQAPGQSSVG